jgi:hypothetical protein
MPHLLVANSARMLLLSLIVLLLQVLLVAGQHG